MEEMLGVGLKRSETGVHSFELPVPKIEKPTQVLVRIKENGICGSDTNMVKHDYKDIAQDRNEIVLGHEGMGVVEKVGKSVKKLKVGDFVTMTVRRPCAFCAPCKNGRSDFCQTGLFNERGIHKLDGFLTEFVVDEEEFIIKVPKGLEKYGVLSEPLSVCEKALEQILFVQSRMPWDCGHANHDWKGKEWGGCKNAVVLGVGPIGFLSAALLRLKGFEVTVVSRTEKSDSRVALTKRLGCEYFTTREQEPEEIGSQLTEGGKRIDLVFEAAGAAELAFRMIPFISRSGSCVLTGIPHREIKATLETKNRPMPSQEPSSVDSKILMRQITRHNLAVIGSVNSNRTHFENALESMREINKEFGNILGEFVSMRVPLKEFKRAFEAEKIMKAVVEIG